MPELPEVETVRRQLTKNISGRRITDVVVRFGKKLSPTKTRFVNQVKGRTINKVERRGKLLRFRLSGGYSMFVHLKMTGVILIRDRNAAVDKHTHLVFKLSGGKEVHWNDLRKFGFLKLLPDDEAETYLASWNFGPEPLERGFTYQVFKDCLLAYPKAKIKPKLLEQSCIAGIGNIYAIESLWRAKIHPLTKIADVPEAKLERLHQAIVAVLKDAVKHKGTTAENYFDAFGNSGGYEKKLKMYKREGRPCLRCRTKLEKIKVGGRGTVICPKCQKL